MRNTNTKLIYAAWIIVLCFSLALLPGREAHAATPNRKNDKKRPERPVTPTTGRLEVSTSPGGHTVLVDGRPVGQTSNIDGPVVPIELPPGSHTVEVVFAGGKRYTKQLDIVAGKRHCLCLTHKTRVVTKFPCLYPVAVGAPRSVSDGDLVTFTSDVRYTGPNGLKYNWTISPANARIVSGQGTPEITIDSTGIGKLNIEAALRVDDGSGDVRCQDIARAMTGVLPLPPPPVSPKQFDEFPSITFDDDKARLDNFAIELQNAPDAKGHVIIYGGAHSPAAQADVLARRTRHYLTTNRGIDNQRLVITRGGLRERNAFELWIVPSGAAAPQATPSVQKSSLTQPTSPSGRGRSSLQRRR